MKTNLLSLFSGIGAFEKALDSLGFSYNLVNYCEIDKYASRSYSVIHNVDESLNLGDITKVDTSKLPSIDLITYGFPCQDISVAGKQKGFEDNGETTRSGLFFEALRIIEDAKPKVALCENVKNLTGNKFAKEFKIVLNSLDEAGYNNYWKVLNAKDYGIPQNRERVFIVSIRKDVDTGLFDFPEGFPLDLRLKDMLEDEVDDKFYLSEKMKRYILDFDDVQKGTKWEGRANNDTLNSNIAHTLSCRGAGGSQRAGVSNFIVDGYDREVTVKELKQVESLEDLKIRRLTPKEVFKLMGFEYEDFEKAAQVNSNTQLYKQAGNSIVVDVLVHLFKKIIESGVLNVKKIEEVKTITFECDDLIDVATLKEKEPELYAELLKDYPCENATYIFKNNRSVAC